MFILADNYGIATVDITTGDFFVTEVGSERALLDEINKFSPSELICNEAFYMSGIDLEDLKDRLSFAVSRPGQPAIFTMTVCRKVLKEHFQVVTPGGAGTGRL